MQFAHVALIATAIVRGGIVRSVSARGRVIVVFNNSQHEAVVAEEYSKRLHFSGGTFDAVIHFCKQLGTAQRVREAAYQRFEPVSQVKGI